jgi:putative transposase
MSLQGSLSIERMCQLTQVSRAGFYRAWQEQNPVEEEMEVRSAIQQIALEHRRRYGYRRIKWELEKRGWHVNHKRIRRILREDDLLGVQLRRWVGTTDSRHSCEVHLNLARHLQLTGINQLWVADMTYIRLRTEFVYLAVILDAFSRKVIGWALGRNLSAELPLAALQRALAERQPPPGLVHHSDRGVQYACADYVHRLRQHGILPSMSRPGNPYDNARCESFFKTLKQEEINSTEYSDLEHLLGNLEDFIEKYYNGRRLHSALNYCSPNEFEQALAALPDSSLSSVPRLSFFRHGDGFQSKGAGEPPSGHSPATACSDEPPAGYSSAGWSPPEPASASPAEEESDKESKI